ncbi:hypothetical protein CAEBREN_28924 [Caenorhabditis brenneri]|uniref:Uncharacterized protein n=1 Tax=Caenorhabditis brenneri TaxID=135651 RepID=G0MPI0_CAEBE|nr:hypothetical protein CAEBREN_28924 [Caenorhabditis brenneri]
MVGDTSDDSPGPSSSSTNTTMTTTGIVDRRSLLSAASMVRQQSDTTGVRRLVRTRAVQEDDPDGPHSSNNLFCILPRNQDMALQMDEFQHRLHPPPPPPYGQSTKSSIIISKNYTKSAENRPPEGS